MQTEIAPLRRGKYVHRVFDPASRTWLFKNLVNQALLSASFDDAQIIDDLLEEPNRSLDSAYGTEIKELLRQYRFLVESHIDELRILEDRYWRNKRAPALRSIAIVTTLQCNLRCEYCYQDHVSERLTEDDEAAIVRLVANSIASSLELPPHDRPAKFSVTWWGGEPLLQAKAIRRLSERIIPLFDAAGIEYGCYTSTNGVLLSKKNAEILKEARLRHAQVTVDGPEPFHDAQRFDVKGRGTYKAVIAGLHNLCSALPGLGRFVTLRVNVTPRMVRQAADWEGFFNDLSDVSEFIAFNLCPAVPNDFYPPGAAIDNPEFREMLQFVQPMALSRGFHLVDTVQEPVPGALYCGAIPDTNWIVLPGRRLTKCTGKFHDRSSDCGRLEADGSLELIRK